MTELSIADKTNTSWSYMVPFYTPFAQVHVTKPGPMQWQIKPIPSE